MASTRCAVADHGLTKVSNAAAAASYALPSQRPVKVEDLSVSPLGCYAATGDELGFLRIWKFAETREKLKDYNTIYPQGSEVSGGEGGQVVDEGDESGTAAANSAAANTAAATEGDDNDDEEEEGVTM